MPGGKLQLDSLGRRRIRSTGERILAEAAPCCCNPGDPCAYCPDTTHDQYLATVAGVTVNAGCLGPFGGGGTDFLQHLTGSPNGTFLMHRITSCYWQSDEIPLQVNYYGGGSCAGAVTNIIYYKVTLSRGPTDLEVAIAWRWDYQPNTTATIGGEQTAFHYTKQNFTGLQPCDATWVATNQIAVGTGIADGGTITFTPV